LINQLKKFDGNNDVCIADGNKNGRWCYNVGEIAQQILGNDTVIIEIDESDIPEL
jgi:hypothetical protein